MPLPESSLRTYMDVTNASTPKKPLLRAPLVQPELSRMSDYELVKIAAENYSPSAQLYGAAMVELVRRLEAGQIQLDVPPKP